MFGFHVHPFAPQLSEHAALLYRRGYWTLVHSKHAEVRHALEGLEGGDGM